MRFKILGLMAAVALVAACETGPEGGAGAGGAQCTVQRVAVGIGHAWSLRSLAGR